VRHRGRFGVARRVGDLEGAFGTELKCTCKVWVEDLDKPWAQTCVLRHRGDDSETCPDCGGQRVVVVMHPAFPLDD
jgi:hypothetical protein